MKTYHLLFHPSKIDLRLVLQDGKVLAHLPNYHLVLPEAPENTDGAMQLLKFEVPDSLVNIVNDGGVDKHYLWAGDRGTRSNPNDLVRVEIAHVGAQAAVTSPPMTARDAFVAFPPAVKLAAVITALPEVVRQTGISVEAEAVLLAWADRTVNDFTTESAKG